MAAQALSDYFEDKILSWLKGTTFPAAPTTLYIGLFTTIPGDTGSGGAPSDGTEVTASNGYARVSLTAASDWSAISTVNTTQRHITNSGTKTFPAATGSWGTVVGWGLWDATTVGNLLFYGSLTSVAITSGMTPSLAAGQIDIGMD